MPLTSATAFDTASAIRASCRAKTTIGSSPSIFGLSLTFPGSLMINSLGSLTLEGISFFTSPFLTAFYKVAVSETLACFDGPVCSKDLLSSFLRLSIV